MTKRLTRFFLMILLFLGLSTAWGCGGCGAGDGPGLPDTSIDTGDDDMGMDVPADGEDTPDAPTDTLTDGDVIEDTPEDTVEEDTTATGAVIPFTSETSGGGRRTSPGYQLELFIGPVRPVGSTSSTNYDLKLGPGGVRSQ